VETSDLLASLDVSCMIDSSSSLYLVSPSRENISVVRFVVLLVVPFR